MASQQNGHDNSNDRLSSSVAHDENSLNTASLPRRALQALLSPFSATALSGLPRLKRPEKYHRADAIPQTEINQSGERPTVRDYHSINLPPNVRVPKKIPTSVKVEGKIWFANERNWVSWLNISVLLATLSLGLFNASKDDIAKNFAYFYAFISVCVMFYGYGLYQYRITMIRRRDPGHFDAIAGPVMLSIALFVGVLANFLFRVHELKEKGKPIPGAELVKYIYQLSQVAVPSSWVRIFEQSQY